MRSTVGRFCRVCGGIDASCSGGRSGTDSDGTKRLRSSFPAADAQIELGDDTSWSKKVSIRTSSFCAGLLRGRPSSPSPREPSSPKKRPFRQQSGHLSRLQFRDRAGVGGAGGAGRSSRVGAIDGLSGELVPGGTDRQPRHQCSVADGRATKTRRTPGSNTRSWSAPMLAKAAVARLYVDGARTDSSASVTGTLARFAGVTLAEGLHAYEVRIEDVQGNCAWPTVELTVDTNAPSCNITQPLPPRPRCSTDQRISTRQPKASKLISRSRATPPEQ